MQVSQRFHNDTYAPGVATYGIPGKPGDSGNPGTSMFFTDFDITNGIEFKQFAQKITSRMLPLKTTEIVLNRKYIDNDIFVLKNGDVYLLTDITKLSQDSLNGNLSGCSDYLNKISQFDKQNSIFNGNNTNIQIKEKLNITDSTEFDGQGLLNIQKVNPGTGDVVFIDIESLYGSAGNQNLKISYDNTLKGFKFSSQYPIFIDSNLYVNQQETLQISNYSPIVSVSNGITNFYSICKELTYNLDSSIYTYTKKDSSVIYYGSIYIITLQDEENILNRLLDFTDSSLMLHFQNKSFQDFQLYRDTEKTYYFKQDYDFVKLNDIITKVYYYDLNDVQMSLIYNIEIYLTKKNAKLLGYSEKINIIN